jgi:predicted dehydrogenase
MSHLTRRELLKSTALTATTAALLRNNMFGAATPVRTRSPNSKLNTACIAVGGRGGSHVGPAAGQNLIAICDTDRDTLNGVAQKYPNAKKFTDYRKLYDEVGKDLDAVFVSTPDHNHACASMMALKLGKAVYCEKPLTWCPSEARALAEETRKQKVATQMGNDRHANGGNRRVVQWIRDGAVGDVKEVHTWTNRPIWPQGIQQRPASKPVPDKLDWDCWIGPAPFRQFHDGLHGFAWRGWFDFGCGAIGDMGCHTWDNVCWSLDPDYPEYIELMEINGKSKETFPKSSKFKWGFPAKGTRPAFVAYWYSGGLKPEVPEEMLNDPARAAGTKKPELPGAGNLYVGTKGKLLVSGDYGDSCRMIPEAAMKAWQEQTRGKESPNLIPSSPGHHEEFLSAAKGEKPWNFPKSNFADYAGHITELMGLGVIAEKLGEIGLKVQCDPLKREVKGPAEAVALVKRAYRQGWTL